MTKTINETIDELDPAAWVSRTRWNELNQPGDHVAIQTLLHRDEPRKADHYVTLYTRAQLVQLLTAERERAERAEHLLNYAGVIEIAVRNPNVESYMKEWEARTETAEARLKEAAAVLNDIATTDPVDNMLDPQRPARLANAALATRASGFTELHFVFSDDGGPANLRFVEVETLDGKSVNVGTWLDRQDGLKALAITIHKSDIRES